MKIPKKTNELISGKIYNCDLSIMFHDNSLLGKGEHFIFLKKENGDWFFLYKDKVLTTSGIEGFIFYEIS